MVVVSDFVDLFHSFDVFSGFVSCVDEVFTDFSYMDISIF